MHDQLQAGPSAGHAISLQLIFLRPHNSYVMLYLGQNYWSGLGQTHLISDCWSIYCLVAWDSAKQTIISYCVISPTTTTSSVQECWTAEAPDRPPPSVQPCPQFYVQICAFNLNLSQIITYTIWKVGHYAPLREVQKWSSNSQWGNHNIYFGKA